MEECRNGPHLESKMGRFRISVWKQQRVIPARSAFDAQRVVETVRVCVRHSRYNYAKRCWDNQCIWCNAEELRDLVQVLDGIDEKAKVYLLEECTD